MSNAKIRVSKNAVVCALHGQSRFKEIKVNGKSRPKDPPSIRPGVPSSTDIITTTTTHNKSLIKHKPLSTIEIKKPKSRKPKTICNNTR